MLIELTSGLVQQIYCHWDGYLEHNGAILLECYRDSAKVNKLIALGDVSSLGVDVGEEHEFNRCWAEEAYTNIGDKCFAAPETTFYGRDRNEKNVGPKLFKDFEDYDANHRYEEYEYILLSLIHI